MDESSCSHTHVLTDYTIYFPLSLLYSTCMPCSNLVGLLISNIFSPKFDVALLADLLDIFDDSEVSERLFCLYIFRLERVDEEVIFRKLLVDDGF